MPPLAFLATHLLSTLLLSTPAPLSLPPPPETDSHTPSTLFLEVGDKRNNRPITLLNSVGLVHLHSAQLGTPGLLHLSLSFGYAHANEFPKPFNDSSYIDTNLWTATFAAAWVFLPWLEAYANYEVASSATNYKPSSSEITTPAAGQMLGDTHFGLKFAHRLFPSFYAGIDLGLRVFTDNQPMRSLRFAFRPVALLSWNLQELSPKLPLTFHSNFGLHIGRNAKASLDELAQPAPNDSNGSNVWTTFAWNLNKRYFGFVGFALEIPLPYATPFVEYQLTLPFWLKEDINPAWKKANPQSLSLGTKLTMLPSFSLFLGAEFQLKSAHVPGLNPLPPWRFFCGISLATQPLPSSGSFPSSSTPPSSPLPSSAPLLGSVAHRHTQKPIADAQINLLGQQLQTLNNGSFQSQPLPYGSYTLEIHAPGYATKTQTIQHSQNAPPHAFLLSPLPPSAPPPPPPPAEPLLSLSLRRGNRPISGLALLRTPSPQNFILPADNPPPLPLPQGPQSLEILPQEGLAKIQKTNLSKGEKQTLVLDIEPTPPSPLVRLVNQRILFSEPLSFSPLKAELTPFGQTQLRGLVDLLIRNHIRNLRIESHVESQKTEAKALQLSAQRSQTVVEALVKLGVEIERMEVLNWGDSRPVAPNTVRTGRLLNRRMDFVSLETWELVP